MIQSQYHQSHHSVTASPVPSFSHSITSPIIQSQHHQSHHSVTASLVPQFSHSITTFIIQPQHHHWSNHSAISNPNTVSLNVVRRQVPCLPNVDSLVDYSFDNLKLNVFALIYMLLHRTASTGIYMWRSVSLQIGPNVNLLYLPSVKVQQCTTLQWTYSGRNPEVCHTTTYPITTPFWWFSTS